MTRQSIAFIIVFLLLNISPAQSFSIDGLNSGMTLDEVKGRGGLQATPFYDGGGFQKFNYGRGSYLTFCHGVLEGFEKRVQSLDQAQHLVRSALVANRFVDEQHHSFMSAGEHKFDHSYRWISGNETAGLHYFSHQDLSLNNLLGESVLRDNFNFVLPSGRDLYRSAIYEDRFVESECRDDVGR